MPEQERARRARRGEVEGRYYAGRRDKWARSCGTRRRGRGCLTAAALRAANVGEWSVNFPCICARCVEGDADLRRLREASYPRRVRWRKTAVPVGWTIGRKAMSRRVVPMGRARDQNGLGERKINSCSRRRFNRETTC